MAYNRGKEERERLFASSGNYGGGQTQFNSHTNKQTALDMEGVHYDKLNRANASTYFNSQRPAWQPVRNFKPKFMLIFLSILYSCHYQIMSVDNKE